MDLLEEPAAAAVSGFGFLRTHRGFCARATKAKMATKEMQSQGAKESVSVIRESRKHSSSDRNKPHITRRKGVAGIYNNLIVDFKSGLGQYTQKCARLNSYLCLAERGGLGTLCKKFGFLNCLAVD